MDGFGVGACEMAAMRLQARAIAFQWLAARGFTSDQAGFSFFYVSAKELGLREDAMQGMRIKVSMVFEQDEQMPVDQGNLAE